MTSSGIGGFGEKAYDAVMTLLEQPMALLQKAIGGRRMPYAFLAPNMILFLIFVFAPIALAIAYSMTGGGNILLSDRPFVGLQNYADLMSCEDFGNPATCEFDLFWTAVHNTGWYVTANTAGTFIAALVTALILNRLIVSKAFFRALFFYPVLLSPVVVGLIWKWFLHRNGLLNAALDGVTDERIIFLLDVNWARFWLVYVSIWFHMGFFTLIILAGLQAIPGYVYEAAKIDGASRWRVFTRITLPLLAPNLLVVFVLLLIRSVQVFDEAWVLTDGGGPGTSNLFIVQFIYETAFASDLTLYGLASAASVLMGLALLILTLVQLWFGKRMEY